MNYILKPNGKVLERKELTDIEGEDSLYVFDISTDKRSDLYAISDDEIFYYNRPDYINLSITYVLEQYAGAPVGESILDINDVIFPIRNCSDALSIITQICITVFSEISTAHCIRDPIPYDYTAYVYINYPLDANNDPDPSLVSYESDDFYDVMKDTGLVNTWWREMSDNREIIFLFTKDGYKKYIVDKPTESLCSDYAEDFLKECKKWRVKYILLPLHSYDCYIKLSMKEIKAIINCNEIKMIVSYYCEDFEDNFEYSIAQSASINYAIIIEWLLSMDQEIVLMEYIATSSHPLLHVNSITMEAVIYGEIIRVDILREDFSKFSAIKTFKKMISLFH